MKKFILLIIFACLSLGAIGPIYHWNFEKESPDGIGTKKKKIYNSKNIEPEIGFNDSGGLLCGKDQKAYIPYCKVFWQEFTVELKFKPSGKSVAGTLFAFNRHSYGRGSFAIKINSSGQISAEFLVKDDSAKKMLKSFRAEGSKNDFAPGEWHVLRVTSASGGKLQIWLDGKLYLVKDESFGFNDLEGEIPKEYPMMSFGLNFGYGGKSREKHFNGVIDDVKVWDCVEELKTDEAVAGMPSVTDHNMSVTDKFEWSVPFQTLDVATELEGAYAKADDKFTQAAATAALRKDDKNLYIRYNCPIPAGTKLKLDGKSVWEGDCVEFFISTKRGGHLQYVANPNGKSEAFHWIQPQMKNQEFKSSLTFISKINPDVYTIEMTIPLEELQLSSGLVRGNFTREIDGGKILSTWASTSSFHNVGNFGKFFIDGRKKHFESLLGAKKRERDRAKPSALRDNISEQLAALEKNIASHGEKAEFYDSLTIGFYNLDQSLIQLALAGKSHVLWKAQVWSNDISISALAKPLEKISLSSPQNSRLLYGLALANLSDKPYMGQIKLLNNEKEEYSFYRTRENNPLTRRIIFKEGIPIEDRSGRILYDPLAPLPLNTLVRAAAKSSVPLWMEIDTAGLKPGIYNGLIMLKAANSGFTDEKIEFELKVTEVDFGKITLDNFNYSYIPSHCFGSKKMMRALDHYDINYIYTPTPGQDVFDIYPEFDKKGNIIRERFEPIDKLLSGYDNVKERKIVIFTAWTLGWGSQWLVKSKRVSQLKIDTPAWNNAMKNFIVALEKYLTTKHGFKSEQIIIYPEDEVGGDIDDPKSHIARAYNYCKMIKDTGSKMRIMLNPRIGKFDLTSKNYKKLSEVVDIFELYRPRLSPEMVEFAKTLNKELWIYSILINTNSPETYRRLSWENMRDGFSPVVAFWHFDGSFAGGDGFNSRDYNPHRKKINTADYSALYVDFDNEMYIPSRRSEAHYQGLLDRKAYEYAKGRGVPEAELQELIAIALKGDMETMDKMREEILKKAQITK